MVRGGDAPRLRVRAVRQAEEHRRRHADVAGNQASIVERLQRHPRGTHHDRKRGERGIVRGSKTSRTCNANKPTSVIATKTASALNTTPRKPTCGGRFSGPPLRNAGS